MKNGTTEITVELRQQVMQEVARGRSVRSVASEYGVSEKSVYRWQKEEAAQRDSGSKTLKELETEVRLLRKRAERAEMEAAILKKAALIFGNSLTKD